MMYDNTYLEPYAIMRETTSYKLNKMEHQLESNKNVIQNSV
jgi:hypothetical protein